MPSLPPTSLNVGDYIRIFRVPDSDLRQRENEIASGAELAGWTADTIERIIASTTIVRVSKIDEYGYPW